MLPHFTIGEKVRFENSLTKHFPTHVHLNWISLFSLLDLKLELIPEVFAYQSNSSGVKL